MQDLTLVGVHDDGEHVIAVSGDGRRFRLKVTEALRAAVHGNRPRLGHLQVSADSRMRPRDIQARIRAGQSAQDVAAEAGLTVEHVRRFDAPVLAERAYVASQAQKVIVRRGVADAAPTLGELVAGRLALRDVDAGDAVWDARRPEDGPWTVQVAFSARDREHTACWVYDPHSRAVTALDDEARWLSEAVPDGAGPLPQRRLSSVRDVTIDLRDDRAAELPDVDADSARPETAGPATSEPKPRSRTAAKGAPKAAAKTRSKAEAKDQPEESAKAPAGPDAVKDSTVELLDNLRDRRGRRTNPVSPAEDDAAEADPLEDLLESLSASQYGGIGEDVDSDPGPNHPAHRAATAGVGEAVPVKSGKPAKRTRAKNGRSEATSSLEPPAAAAGSGGGSAVYAPAARRSRRASVPSWDDIVFGSRRD